MLDLVQETVTHVRDSAESGETTAEGTSSPIKMNQLQRTVLKYQSRTEKGYYGFEEWKELHTVLFVVDQKSLTHTIINGWRMLKLINFGDDFVPSGLVHDTLSTVMNVEQSVDEADYLLKTIFFKFIQFNKKPLSARQREELAFFRVIRSIVQGYRKIIFQSLRQESGSQSKERPDRNEQLYRLHNVFTYKKNLSALKKIEEEFKQCTFEPEINRKSQTMQSRYLQQKTCRVNAAKSMLQPVEHDYGTPVIDESSEYEDNKLFRASPVPAYPDVAANGICEHLERMQKSREINRYNSIRSVQPRALSKDISEFTIGQREEERKEREVDNFRILFLIKVEVGKRVYRVKVRENMTVEDVVRNIEKMVGFSEQNLEDVVKEYFFNWQKRTKAKLAEQG